MTQLAFDTEGIEISEYESPPPGEYPVVIEESDIVRNSKDTGDLIKLKLQIVDGELRGKPIFATLNINHESEEADRIGRQQLATLIRACGKAKIANTVELHGIKFVVRLKPRKDGDGTEVKAFKPDAGRRAAASSSPAATATAGTAKKGNSKRPW